MRGGQAPDFGAPLVSAFGEIAADERLEPAFRALALTLPMEGDIAREIGSNVDPDAIFAGAAGLAGAHRSQFQGGF